MNKPLVVDLYHGNDVTDFNKTKAFGIIGVIHKCSQGLKMWDGAYATRRKLAANAGLKWGAYHFLSMEDGAAQADHCLSVCSPDPDTLVALDWERNIPGGVPSVHIARAFLERIAEKLGRKAKIYSGDVAKEQLRTKDAWFSSHDFWLAQYGLHWSVPPSWMYPWLWQNNGDNVGVGPHRIPGLVGLVDNSCVVDPMTEAKLIETWAL